MVNNGEEISDLNYQDHIIRFINFIEEDQPMLMTEYLPMGNLAEQHKIALINN